MTQHERIIDYMQTNGSITALQAMLNIGCMRLSSRISELKKAGYPIRSEWTNDKNRYGDNIRYKKYMLQERADENGA